MSQNIFNIKDSINGDSIIGFTSAKTMKNQGFLDSSRVATYLMGDEGPASHKKHLGLIQLFETTHNVSLPFMKNLFAGSAVLEVDRGQTITYDLPVKRMKDVCMTAEDTSTERDAPGIDGTVFKLILNEQFTKGDILTYNPTHGEQVMVSADHDVQMVGENYLHWVILMTTDKTAYYPADKLKAGIKYMKIGNAIPEFGQNFSGINMTKNPSGSITNEFILGSPRGVETFMTREAAGMKAPGFNAFTDAMMENVNSQLEAMGGNNNMFYMGRLRNGQFDASTAKIGTTLEYLALMELAMMECHSLLFAKAAVVPTANGVLRVNEGVWHQLRRGKIIKYSKPGSLTINHIHEAASYIYKNSTVPISERFLKFKAGYFAWMNVMQIFREEAIQQLNGLPVGMVGNDSQLPQPVFKGNLNELEMQEVRIKSVFIPGVGKVIVEHDPSLDYQPLADRFSQGASGHQMAAHTSYSLVIWNAGSAEYSNVTSKVRNASVVDGGNNRANIYYVKRTGEPAVTYGYEQGRMANEGSYENIQSSLKYMGRTFWALNESGALVLDTTATVMIELQDLK